MRDNVFQHYKGGLYTKLFVALNATNKNDRDRFVVYVSLTQLERYMYGKNMSLNNLLNGQMDNGYLDFVVFTVEN